MKDSMLTYVSRGIIPVLEFFDSRGVGLGYTPTFRLMGSYIEYDLPPMYAAVRAGMMTQQEFEKSDKTRILMATMKAMGLDVSREAVEDLILSADFSHNSPFLPEEGEICIFEEFRELVGTPRAEYYLAHETWHMKEKDAGVIHTHPAIIEGTADYAGWEYMGGHIYLSDPNSFTNGPITVMVYRVLKNEENPLRALLRPEVRGRISQTIIEEISGLIPDIESMKEYTRSRVEEGSITEFDRRMLASPTKKTLLAGMREVGAERLADELEPQDVSLYLEMYRLD